jgi:hypothetical protein
VAYPDLAPERLKGAGVDLAKLIFVLTSRRIPHPWPVGLVMNFMFVSKPIFVWWWGLDRKWMFS